MVDAARGTPLDPDAIAGWIRQRFPAAMIASAGVSDCAIFESEGAITVATTDFINSRPIIFELEVGGMYELGKLVVAANLADLLGSGAKPHSILISAVFPRGTDRDDFTQLMDGVGDMAERCGLIVVGGDTKLGTALAVCGTAIGFANRASSVTPRHHANAGDEVWVSGPLGSTACAVHSFRSTELDEEWKSWAIDRLRNPVLPLKQAGSLRELAISTAGCDISDGLGMDISGLAAASSLGVEIDASTIPVEPNVIRAAALKQIPAWIFAFASGGDFQIATTAPAGAQPQLEAAGFHRIGHLTTHRDALLRLEDARVVPLPIRGHGDARNMSFTEEIDYLVRTTRMDLNV